MVALEHRMLTADTLAQISLFEGERTDLLEWLATRCDLEIQPAGTLLLSPDRHDDRAFYILEGQVQIYIGDTAGQPIAVLEAGQIIGEMSVIDKLAPSATVRTTKPCTVIAIDGSAFRSLIDQSSVLARNLLKLLARRLRRDNQMVGQSMAQQAQSELAARADALTGLHNRRWLNERFSQSVFQSRTDNLGLSVLMLDIDRFKRFNDTHGHLAGDRALITVANIINSHIRTGDHAARFGGEEFLIILPNTDAAEAHRIARRLRRAIHRTPVTTHDGAELPSVTASIGLAEWNEAETWEALVARADQALYRAKRRGRNRVAISQAGDTDPKSDSQKLRRSPHTR